MATALPAFAHLGYLLTVVSVSSAGPTPGPDAAPGLTWPALRYLVFVEPSWRFEVTDTCVITGRGLAVFGVFAGTIGPSPQDAVVTVHGVLLREVQVYLEFARRRGGEEVALLIPDATEADVPRGAVIIPPASRVAT